MEKEIEISPLKRYIFPKKIQIISHRGNFLVVSIDTANWIVLDNESQLQFFNLLKDYNLEDALNQFDGLEEDAQWVVIQLEARQFESAETHLKQQESSVHIYLTNGCNMRCPHCYMYAGEKVRDELSKDEIFDIINRLTEGGIQSVVLSGGEPLMNPHFHSIVRHAHELGLRVEVLTNGTLWTDKLIDDVYSYLDKVQISIDGYDENTNSRLRGKGNFEKSLRTVDKLLAKGVTVSVAMVPLFNDSIEADVDKYIDFGRSLLHKYHGMPFDFNVVGDVWDGRSINMTPDERRLFKLSVSKIFRGIFGEDSEDGAFIEYHKHFGLEENCAYGNLSISANGDVYLCAQIQPLNVIGNVKTDSIIKLLQKSKEAKEKSEVSKIKPCADCAIKYICGGDCRIKYFSYLDEGNIPSDNQIPERECSREYKESMYDLMIRTNEFIFQ